MNILDGFLSAGEWSEENGKAVAASHCFMEEFKYDYRSQSDLHSLSLLSLALSTHNSRDISRLFCSFGHSSFFWDSFFIFTHLRQLLCPQMI
jgi:hypothetical protein